MFGPGRLVQLYKCPSTAGSGVLVCLPSPGLACFFSRHRVDEGCPRPARILAAVSPFSRLQTKSSHLKFQDQGGTACISAATFETKSSSQQAAPLSRYADAQTSSAQLQRPCCVCQRAGRRRLSRCCYLYRIESLSVLRQGMIVLFVCRAALSIAHEWCGKRQLRADVCDKQHMRVEHKYAQGREHAHPQVHMQHAHGRRACSGHGRCSAPRFAAVGPRPGQKQTRPSTAQSGGAGPCVGRRRLASACPSIGRGTRRAVSPLLGSRMESGLLRMGGSRPSPDEAFSGAHRQNACS